MLQSLQTLGLGTRKRRRSEKIDKYTELAWELRRIWKVQTRVLPVVIEALRTITTRHKERFPFVWKTRSFWWDNKWNSPSHWKFFGKKGIASDVISHCYRNDQNITEPFASSDSRTMLLGEMRGSFPNIASGRNRSI